MADRLKVALTQSPGETPVEVVIQQGATNKVRALPIRVRLTQRLCQQLMALLGRDAVRIVRTKSA
jgi:hypothetical protein